MILRFLLKLNWRNTAISVVHSTDLITRIAVPFLKVISSTWLVSMKGLCRSVFELTCYTLDSGHWQEEIIQIKLCFFGRILGVMVLFWARSLLLWVFTHNHKSLKYNLWIGKNIAHLCTLYKRLPVCGRGVLGRSKRGLLGHAKGLGIAHIFFRNKVEVTGITIGMIDLGLVNISRTQFENRHAK